MSETRHGIKINRAPVLTLWAAVVAERLGFDWDEALTLGRAVAGLNAHSKGVRLGLFTPTPKDVKEAKRKAAPGKELHIDLLGRAVPAAHTPDGIRALSKDRPTSPASVERYLESKFGEAYAEARDAMRKLAKSIPPGRLATDAFRLYEKFRPSVPAGVTGWGAAGHLDLDAIRRLAERNKDD
ncbi:MAG TPA: hypothetical protein VEJ16_00675 [Alphaproteobacteria bacterium]|nr:hypothetical protein [Alphaproteobacteria bacterium]